MLFCLYHADKQIQNVCLDVKFQDRNVLCESCLLEDNHAEILLPLPDFIQQTACSDKLSALKKKLLSLNETVQEQKEIAITTIASCFSDLKRNISMIIDQSEAEVRSHLWDNVESFRGIFSKMLQEVQESYHVTLRNKKALNEWADSQLNPSSNSSQFYDKADNVRKLDTLRSLIRMESQKLPHLERIHRKLEEAEIHSRLNLATTAKHFEEAADSIKASIKGIYSKIAATCLKSVDIEVHTEPPCLNYRSVFEHSVCSVQLLHTIYAHSAPISSILSLNHNIPQDKNDSKQNFADKCNNSFENNQEAEWKKPQKSSKHDKEELNRLDNNPDVQTQGQFLSTSWDGLIKVWAVNEKQPILQISTFNGGIVAASIVDSQTNKNNRAYTEMNQKQMIACSYYDSSVELIDITQEHSNSSVLSSQKKRILGRIQPQEKIINSIINKGDLVICGCSSSAILSIPINRFSESSSSGFGFGQKCHSESVTGLSDMSCLSASVFASTGADKLINLWDLRMDEPIKAIYSPHAANHVTQISPYLFVVSSLHSMLKIMDVRMFKELLSFYGHRDAVQRTAGFFPNIMRNQNGSAQDSHCNSSLTSLFVSAGNDNLIKVWNPFENQALRFTLKGHADVVWALEVDPLNSMIYSGDRNEEIKIWEYSM